MGWILITKIDIRRSVNRRTTMETEQKTKHTQIKWIFTTETEQCMLEPF